MSSQEYLYTEDWTKSFEHIQFDYIMIIILEIKEKNFLKED